MRKLSALVAALALVLPVLSLTGTSAVAAGSFTVTAKANTTKLVFGHKVIITGTVTPNAAGKKVVLQKRYSQDADWVDERTATIDPDGSYRVTDLPSSTKTRWYRVVKPASATRSAGASDVIRVQVYQWKYLTSKSSVDSSTDVETGQARINGKIYKNSIVLLPDGNTEWVEYNLNRRCIKLDATYGVEDASETGAGINLEVLGDGNSLYTKDFALGQSDRAVVKVGRVLRIRIEATDLTDNNEDAGVGTPRILCS